MAERITTRLIREKSPVVVQGSVPWVALIIVIVITITITIQIQIQIQKMFIAIIHNMNTWGRYCIRLSHQIALQYTSQLSAENYTLVTVQHIRETNSTYYGNGSTKPFRIYGLHIWSTFNAYTKKQVQGAKHFQWTLHSHIDVLAQGRSISIGLATGTLQSCNKPTIWFSCGKTVIGFGSSYL